MGFLVPEDGDGEFTFVIGVGFEVQVFDVFGIVKVIDICPRERVDGVTHKVCFLIKLGVKPLCT